MGRKQITQELSERLEKFINPYHDTRIYFAKEVTFDYATSNAVRVDYMQFKPADNSVGGIEKGDFYCYEVKSCIEDFESGHGLNFIGDFNYIITPKELYEQIKNKIPYYVGVYIPSEDPWRELKSIKKAKKRNRDRPASEMLLMMFRSCNRELIKSQKQRIQISQQYNRECD